jgi:hypothetical protein
VDSLKFTVSLETINSRSLIVSIFYECGKTPKLLKIVDIKLHVSEISEKLGWLIQP